MDGWMDGWMEGWTDGRTDGRTDGWMYLDVVMLKRMARMNTGAVLIVATHALTASSGSCYYKPGQKVLLVEIKNV